MRAEAPGTLFEALCAAAEQEHNTAALAYVFGFCTNYALDRVTRPFIQAQPTALRCLTPAIRLKRGANWSRATSTAF